MLEWDQQWATETLRGPERVTLEERWREPGALRVRREVGGVALAMPNALSGEAGQGE